MRTEARTLSLMALMLLSLISPLGIVAEARSVHDTSTVDLFPQGDLTDASQWSLGSETSFTQAAATYTETMVADQRLTMLHQRPVHLDTMTVWSSASPTNSTYSVGAPDGASTWSTGPEIQLTTFDTSGLANYELVEVHMLGVFQIPDALQEDTVRISVEYDGTFDLLKTFAHTQGNVDYINNTAYRLNLTDMTEWTWSTIQNLVFTLDYVSAGGIDDSRLVVDALGLDITVKTPWYGGEVGIASSTFSGHELPVLPLDFESGQYDNMAIDECGLTPSVPGTSGMWTSALLHHPPDQTLGRTHVDLSNGSVDGVTVEIEVTHADGSIDEFFALTPNTLLPPGEAYRWRLTVTDACVSSAWVDVNDPTLSLSGRVFGTNDGIDPEYSRWLVFVNDQLVSNEAMNLGSFTHQWPIGEFLEPGTDSYNVLIKAWFTWDSDGNESHTALELHTIAVSGGYAIQWDEDPVCESVGDQVLTEDNGGLILPLIRRCTDDRTANNDLTVTFSNSHPELLEVDLAEGDVRLRLLPEGSGQAVVGVTVTDSAGNTWQDAFTVTVDPVDDPPEVWEFQSLIPVERDMATMINLTWSDVDTATGSVTASTNRSWASVDLASNTVTVVPPTAGFQSVLISVCDMSSCTERIIDLEVMALPDLVVETIDVGDDPLVQGQVISMRVLVRNQGQADATLVSVRCETDDQLIGIQTIPLLQPGELRAVICDWQIPDDARVVRLNAVLDRGMEITEGDETNNELESLLAIEEQSTDTSQQSTAFISTQMLWVIMLLLGGAVIGLVAFMMPDKIKKIE